MESRGLKDSTLKAVCGREVGHSCMQTAQYSAELFVRRATFGAEVMSELAVYLRLDVDLKDAAVGLDPVFDGFM